MRTVAAASVLVGIGSSIAARTANAQGINTGPLPGCSPSNNTPPKCICFLSSTRLKTPAGEVAIDDLRIGDLVTTASGAPRPIKWIGTLRFERQSAGAWPQGVLPVRIAKDAFGEGNPHRDLYLSQAHLVYLGGVLIPVSNLLNGKTITVAEPEVESLDYFHLELDAHDVLLAEGAPCESLLATQASRKVFDNYPDYVERYGEPSSAIMLPCAAIASFNGRRSELKSRLRSALAPIADYREPLDVVRDHIEDRALRLKAA